MWAAGANDLYVGGTDTAGGELIQFSVAVVWRYDGNRWSTVWADRAIEVDILGFGATSFDHLWGDTSKNIYALGSWYFQSMEERDSGNLGAYTVDSVWHEWPPGGGSDNIYGLWGTSAADLYAVGLTGKVLKFNGTGWTALYGAREAYFNYLWGTSSTDIWAAGATNDSTGALVHFDGSTWTPTTIPEVASLGPLWGSSPSDYFVIGLAGTQTPLVGSVYHYDGSQWTPMNIGTNVELTAIWGQAHPDGGLTRKGRR